MTDLFTWIQTNDISSSTGRSLQAAACIPRDRLLNQLSKLRSQRQKIRDSIEAIRLLKQLQTENRPATIDEQVQLCLHLGAGLSADLFVEPPKSEWAKLATELKELLPPQEFDQMRGTMTTAYYTPPAIVECIYEGLSRIGCTGGEWLEPTAGNGLFIGLTPNEWATRWTGVEIDPISGSICQMLYPEATIYLQALERTRLATHHFDGCIGNVPYSEVTPYDPQFVGWSLDGLHNYCLARSIQAVRPGGIIAVLTSVGTLQSKRSQAFRERISSLVRLLGAFKLPMTAFRSFSHTDAPADLIFFQVLAPGEEGNAEEWIELVESPILNPETQEPLLLNRYFQTHPQHLLGELAIDKLYASPRLSLKPTYPDLPQALSQALRDLPENIYRSRLVQVALSSNSKDCLPIPPELQSSKPFAYVWYRDQPYQCRDGQLHRIEAKGMKRKRLWWLIQIRDAVRQVLDIQWESDDDRELEQAQLILNQRYDEFITQYGWLHSQGNELAFGDDPEYPLLLALEVWNPDRPEETEKADLFFKRTLVRVPTIDRVESATEALVHSLADRGIVDLPYMSELYCKSEAEIVPELQQSETTPLIFRDPVSDCWITAEEYLSGNVRLKLEQADTAAQQSPAYLINLEALKQVQPKPLKAGQIYARLGSPWIPAEVIADFIRETLGIQESSIARSRVLNVSHSVHSAHWKVEYRGSDSTLISAQYGTSRVSAIRLIELALNQKLPVVYDTIDKDTRVKNRDETRRALLKQERLKELFKRWIWQDWKRATQLVEIYNRDFNCLRRRQFDGTHLKSKLQGVSTTWLERLYNPKRAYQLNAIWRIISSGNTLIQYPTGSGKTAIAIVAAQEMRHHHQCSKPALVVKDHLVLQQAAEAAQIYPGLRILTISTRDLDSAKKRQELVSRAATGEWDFIVLSQTSFKMLKLRPETIDSIIDRETGQIREQQKTKRSGKRAAKQLEKKVDRAEEKIRQHTDSVQRDNTVYWEDLGIDLLLVDESQDYLGLATETQMQGVLGISSSNSDRALDLYYKSQYLAQRHGRDKGLVLLTATPIQNTLGQSWVNLVYLCPQVLEARGIRHFDSFISTFAEPRVSAEITAATTLEIKTRLASWSNLPEFRELWLLTADIVIESQLDIEKPKPNYQTVEVPATPAQLKFFDYIAARAKKLQGRRSKTDNYPLITTHVKQGVIDLRCLPIAVLRQFLSDDEIGALTHEHSKLEQFIEDTYQTWAETQTERCTQLLFVDIGHGFIHPYLKRRLIDRGIPEHELAFAQDATTDEQKAQLFRRVRQGDVRILCGSTPTIGAGTQIPDRLKVLRHLDCPLRPTDRWQRDGRILRPGNMHSEVEIVSYVTTGKPYQNEENKQIQGLSPDSYLYEVNVRKARFIEEGLYQTDETVRTIEDIDETTLDFSLLMATATGDRRLLEKVELDNQIQKLLIEEQDWQGTQIAIAQQLDQLPHQIESVQQALKAYQHDSQTLIPTQGEAFQLMLNSSQIPYTKRSEAAQAIQDIATDLVQSRRAAKQAIGTFAGFELWIEHEPVFQSTVLRLQGNRSYETEVRETAKGTLSALEHCPDQIAKAIQNCDQSLQTLTAELEQIRPLYGQPFEKVDVLKTALERQEHLNEALGLMTEAQMDAVALAA